MKLRLIAPAVLLALAACGGAGNKLTHGQVVDKDYDDPDTWTSFVCGYTDPKTGVCQSQIPVTHTDPARYSLRIKGIVDDKTIVEWHSVDESTYHKLSIGDQWEK